MRKIKFAILFSCLFLLSGCSAEYNLTIDEFTMEEDINAIFDKSSESELASRMEQVRRTAFYNFDTRKNEYYDFTKEETDSNIILKYNYRYSGNDLYKSEAASRCYYKRIVNVTDEFITISTDNQVACLYKDGEKQIDDITVNIKTDLPVVSNNADNVDGNTYTWYINDENYNDKAINIKISKEAEKTSFIDGILAIILLIVIIIIIAIIMYVVVRRKNDKNNKIK